MGNNKKIVHPSELTKEISEEYFIERVGRAPENDDLERCNCKEAGKIGHFYCGWCKKLQLTSFYMWSFLCQL